MIEPSIYDYIKKEESAYDTQEIRVGNNWLWNMKNHIQMIFHLKNSQFFTGENNWLRAFKNIMQPILNLAYWSEDIEVKDIVFTIEGKDDRALSFLIKKYHDEVYVKENNVDTLLDEITEDDVDYGGVLIQKGEKRPEVINLASIAFCDQTDIMGGPLAFKFNFTPSSLRKMSSKGWGDKSNGANISINDLITLAEAEKSPSGNYAQSKNKTTGKNIEVYIVRGSLPEHYLLDNDNVEDYYDQVHIVGFYTNKDNKQEGVTLFRKKEKEGNLLFHTSKKVYGRALGQGWGEMLLHPQIWTNFLEIHKMNMLEAGAKNVLYTDDPAYTERQKINDMDNNEITTVAENKRIFRVPTDNPTAVQLFENSVNSWFSAAQTMGSAQDPMLGKEAVSGTTFRGQTQTIQIGRGIHDRRRGQRAKFVEELYRKFIIPDIKKKILNGYEFLATLDMEEMKWVSEQMITKQVNHQIVDAVIQGKEITEDEKNLMMETERKVFAKKGNKRLLKILEGEFKDIEINIGINVTGKQKNLAMLTDKILSIFQFAFSNPQGFQQVMQINGMGSAFNDILEFSGMSPVDFSSLTAIQQPLQQPLQATPMPIPQEMTASLTQNA